MCTLYFHLNFEKITAIVLVCIAGYSLTTAIGSKCSDIETRSFVTIGHYLPRQFLMHTHKSSWGKSMQVTNKYFLN